MIRPFDVSVLAPPPGASAPPGETARFNEVLTHAVGASIAGSAKDDASTLPKGLAVNPQMLMAADDAWVEVVAVAEELRNPALPQEKRQLLLKNLAESWRLFQSQSEPIARMLEEYALGESAAGAEPRSTGM